MISSHQTCTWKTNADKSVLQNGNNFFIKNSARGRPSYTPCSNTSQYSCSCPVDIYYERNKLRIFSTNKTDKIAPKNRPDVYNTILPNHQLPTKVEKKIVTLIKKNRLLYGSDASIKNNKGSFAWGILDRQNITSPLIQYHAHIHGDEEQVHSTQGELFGLLACMRHILYLKNKYKVFIRKQIKIFIYTGSTSSITIATKNPILSSKSALDNDSDIKCKQVKKIVSLQFVPSHQDDSKPFLQLSTASKLNVLMDKYAKRALDDNSKPQIRHNNMIPHLTIQRISFRNSFYRLTRDTLLHLNRYKAGLQVETYIMKKHDLTPHQMQNIQWNDIDNVFRGASIAKRTQFIKIFHQKWLTTYRNKRWKQSPTDQCPLCTRECEDSMHVYQCNDHRAKTTRSLQILELKKNLRAFQLILFLSTIFAALSINSLLISQFPT